jgi:hypothetical protein
MAPPGSPILQPTDERRRTGSHYTPRSLTEPIVQHALEPAFERLGPNATPDQVLELKVCDPAMGSGAFLVEACRALGERLEKAWERWPETRPKIPADEDEALHARRLVAQRCIYGVDKNPRAVDLARLSPWLATLAKDHEFTFLDHALRGGDSLVGLTISQIAAANWDESKPGLPLFRKLVKETVAETMQARAEIRSAPDDIARSIQETRQRIIEDRLTPVRTIGDALVSAFFAADKAKAREKERATIESWLAGGSLQDQWEKLNAAAASLRAGEHPISPFHWEIEFPEGFARDNGGFDAIVGNPPFAGKNTVAASNSAGYALWLQTLHEASHGNADLVAHFFRRAFGLLRAGGAFGLIATNTIAQGDTRSSGLTAILREGAAILRAKRRLKWPGEAAVTVSVLHIFKGKVHSAILDDRPVRRISSYLVEGDFDTSPSALASNSNRAFQGPIIFGDGFIFDDTNQNCNPTSLMQELIDARSENASRIKPMLGGEEFLESPAPSPRRYVIAISDLTLEDESSWPELFELVRRGVKPMRDKQNREGRKRYWWRWGETSQKLQRSITQFRRTLVHPFTSTHLAFNFVDSDIVFVGPHYRILYEVFSAFAVLQGRTHEIWARFFASTLEDRMRYSPSDSFRTFPFPENFETDSTLEAAGEAYHIFRAELMTKRNEGLTKIYNRFHARGENAPDIARLRVLHAEMDVALLRAYGWDDLAERAVPEFIEQEADEVKTPKTRLDWPSDFRDEVLARLIALNAERAAAENAAGLTAVLEDEEDLDEAAVA